MSIDLSQINKLLIVKISSIGDLVHASPVVPAFKRSFPHLSIGWVVEDRHLQVVQGAPGIDEFIVVPHKQWRSGGLKWEAWRQVFRTGRELRDKGYELALDLQGLGKSAIWAWFSGARFRLGGHRVRREARLILYRIPVRTQGLHVVDQYLDAVRWLGAEPEPVEFPLFIPEEARQQAHQKLARLEIAPGTPFVSMNPSAGQERKRWAIDKFAELSDRIERDHHLPVVFVGGPGDLPLEARLKQLKQAPLRSLIGQTSLKEVMEVVRATCLHICGDTGTAHMAAAFQTPCVSLFGPTDPDRNGPYGQRERVLYKRPQCQSCGRKCRTYECLQWITVDEVLSSSAAWLQ